MTENTINYYQNFKDKNKDKITQKQICDVCGGSYTYYNRSTHNRSDKHKNALVEVDKKPAF